MKVYTAKANNIVELVKGELNYLFHWLEFAELSTVSASKETSTQGKFAHEFHSCTCTCVNFHFGGTCAHNIARLIKDFGPGTIPNQFSAVRLCEDVTFIRKLPPNCGLLRIEELEEIYRKKLKRKENLEKSKVAREKQSLEKLRRLTLTHSVTIVD